MNISEQTKRSILKSVLDSADELNELRRSILLEEDFYYLDAAEVDTVKKPIVEADIKKIKKPVEIKVNNKIDLGDYPTQIGNFGNERDEMVSELAMKNRKTHEMEIHEQIRTALMNCMAYTDVNQLLDRIKNYESKVKYTGDGHPYNLESVVEKIYKDYGCELIKKEI